MKVRSALCNSFFFSEWWCILAWTANLAQEYGETHLHFVICFRVKVVSAEKEHLLDRLREFV